jgi:protein ImuA
LVLPSAEPEETIKVERVSRRRVLTPPIILMAVFGLAGWLALLSATFATGIGIGAPPLAFTAFLLSRLGPGTLLWCRQPSASDARPYAPALSAWFDPARLLMVTARREEDLFWAMEEGLRTPGIAAVVGETRATDPTVGRRLSLAAEKNGVPALLLRPQPAPPQSVCTTRWRVASAPSRDLRLRWQVELRRNRFGTPSAAEAPSWLLEWNDETGRLAVVSQTGHGSTGAPQRQRLVG